MAHCLNKIIKFCFKSDEKMIITTSAYIISLYKINPWMQRLHVYICINNCYVKASHAYWHCYLHYMPLFCFYKSEIEKEDNGSVCHNLGVNLTNEIKK